MPISCARIRRWRTFCGSTRASTTTRPGWSRVAAGESWRRGQPSRSGPEALEEAKRNLDRFLVVGLTERFDETFILIRRALGWKLPYYLTANVTTRPKPATQDTLEQIRERNRLDLELYDFANQRLSADVAKQGPSFARELAAFKALNKVPKLVYPHLSGRGRRILRSVLPR